MSKILTSALREYSRDSGILYLLYLLTSLDIRLLYLSTLTERRSTSLSSILTSMTTSRFLRMMLRRIKTIIFLFSLTKRIVLLFEILLYVLLFRYIMLSRFGFDRTSEAMFLFLGEISQFEFVIHIYYIHEASAEA